MTLVEEAFALVKNNRRTTGGYTYTVPSPDVYPYQWLWDSCFHAIVLAKSEPEAAKDELRALVARQFADGMIPHIIYWVPGTLHFYDWGTPGTSALTQPPMLAYAVWAVYEATKDDAFLSEMLPSLKRFYTYLIDKRDPNHHHLIGIINPDESGEDNSPRFDDVLHVPSDINMEDHLSRRLELVDANRMCHFDAAQCMKRHFWVKDVPFNAILIENLRLLAELAGYVGDDTLQAWAATNTVLIESAMRERLWEGGEFWSASASEDYELLRVSTWAKFAPLFAGLYSEAEARALVEKELFNTATFWSSYGMRTVSKTEDSYRSDGYWRGSVWIAPHWFVYRGLVRYGFLEEAKRIREVSEALLTKSGFREYFNPETGEGYGAHSFTWGALITDMIEA